MNKKITFALMAAMSLSSQASDWNYDRQGNDWHGVCHSGKQQSPIDIVTGQTTPSNFVATADYTNKALNGLNNGHSVQFNPQERTLQLMDAKDGKPHNYTLVQFHLHNGSEHTVDGKRYALEAHFVHADKAYLAGKPEGKLAVVGVFLTPGQGLNQQGRAWDRLLAELPEHSGQSVRRAAPLDVLLASPGKHQVYHYSGSLTTPGCNEIVSWVVLGEPVTISQKTVESFAASQHGHKTYRNPQPLNGRSITRGVLKSM